MDVDVVSHCVDRLREAGDGGERDLDKALAEGVVIQELPTNQTGFYAWTRDGESRGTADYLFTNDSLNSDARVLYLHGGGYRWYSPQDVYRPFTTRIAARTGLPVLAIDYRKAPEHPFPGGVEDALQAAVWLMTNGPNNTNTPVNKIFIMGDSAGGGLALAAVVALKRNMFPQYSLVMECIAGVIAISAYTDLTHSTASYGTRVWNPELKTGDPIFSDGDDEANIRESSHKTIASYLGDTHPSHPVASPMFASQDDLRGVPPLLLLVGDAEVMLNDTLDFAAKASASGSEVQTKVYPRMWHVWVMYEEGCGGERGPLTQATEAIQDMVQFCHEKRKN
eukprot:c20314_g1_i1.p1 GENE.c20314_g1_i1~~c20314_g1_i1.p1  ORF type:complete len:337 (+),score=71.01 c20314_g1_i1:33-1043(+)